MSRVALVHDWLVAHRGGEKVLLELARLFDDAPIYTLVADRSRIHRELAERDIRTSFIQRLPAARRRFRALLPLFPRAIESFDLESFDLVISTSHCVAKGVLTRSDAIHVSYVHTPMRYIWDQYDVYAGPWLRSLGLPLVYGLRRWDVASAQRPQSLLANSHYVAERIERVWQRAAQVIHPPVDVSAFSPAVGERSGYLVVCALVPYKRVDLAVRWAVSTGASLTVIGAGAEAPRLKGLAQGQVAFRSQVSQEALAELYRRSEALIHCGVEDFGIAPVEAMSAGCPVIAFNEGGLTETVVDGQTGVFFDEMSVASLAAAVSRFESLRIGGHFNPVAISRHASQFSAARFKREFISHLEDFASAREILRNALRLD